MNKDNTTQISLEKVKIKTDVFVEILKLLDCNEFLIFFDIELKSSKILDVLKNYQVFYDRKGNIKCVILPLDEIDILNDIAIICDLCILSSYQDKIYDKLINNMSELIPKKLIKNNEIKFMIDFNNSESYIDFFINTRYYDVEKINKKIDNLL